MEEIVFYDSPRAMEPLYPDDKKLENLAVKLIKASSSLSSSFNPITREALSDFFRPMNSYYSNLIEGHDTHPIDIDKALRNDYSSDKKKRNLQIESIAHINTHKKLMKSMQADGNEINPCSIQYILDIHKAFYEELPDEFVNVTSKEGNQLRIEPGKFRTQEVEVGRHIAPKAEKLDAFMFRFCQFYNPESAENSFLIRRVINIAASHHRLAWIHPFLDGNGRVVRMHSDVCFAKEDLHGSGLWSISRGLARNKDDYYKYLAMADQPRLNDYDGRGNLSSKMLGEFCKFFLEIAIDQVKFMIQMLDQEALIKRIERFVELNYARGKLRIETKYVLIEMFLKGKISKLDAERVTNLSDKTLKTLILDLDELGFVDTRKEGRLVVYYLKIPIRHSAMLFPNLYPSDKEAELTGL